MARLESPSKKSSNYILVVELNGRQVKFSTRTKYKEIAEAVLKRVQILEDAVRSVAGLESTGLLDWLEHMKAHNPRVYEQMEKAGLTGTKKAKKRRSDYAMGDTLRRQWYMTVDDVAKMLKCSVRTVNYLRTNDGLPCVKLGRLVRFPLDKVQAWLEQKMGSVLPSMIEHRQEKEEWGL